MPSTCQPRRPRASPLWQLVHHGWDEFLASYESKYRQFVFTIPKVLRGIFRKRRQLITFNK